MSGEPPAFSPYDDPFRLGLLGEVWSLDDLVELVCWARARGYKKKSGAPEEAPPPSRRPTR